MFEITKIDPSQIEDGTPVITNPVVYTKRIDFINDNLLYKGEAVIGSNPASGSWRIARITIGNDGDVTEEYSSSVFDKIWNDRLTLTYT